MYFLNRLKSWRDGTCNMSELYPEPELDNDKSYVLTAEQKKRYMMTNIKAIENVKK